MTNFNELSDNLLTQIKNYIDYEINQGVRLDSAIVSKVHTDGTVDIYFPPDKNKIFTKVQNQSIYQNLQPGDGVKVIYENGSESSCWIIGKHKGGKIGQNFLFSSKNTIAINNNDIIEVEILDTLFEQIELTDENPDYTFSPALILNTNDLYYINYEHYDTNGNLDKANSYNNFCEYETNSIIFLSNNTTTQLKITSSSMTDTWREEKCKSIISLYKVKINVLDSKKLKAINKEGYDTQNQGSYSHAEGRSTKAFGYNSHAEGYSTTAFGNFSHAEGSSTTASGNYSHAEGYNTIASGHCSHAKGQKTTASGNWSYAEGHSTTASGELSHAEGYNTTASGVRTHAEGGYTTALGSYSHAEGSYTTASGDYSHAEGSSTTAYGNYSHAEGHSTTASGPFSHAEGVGTRASGAYSHAGGFYTIASGNTQFVIGEYNVQKTDSSVFIIGKGSSDTSRANIFRATDTATYGKTYNSSGADYAEYFEWEDKNINNEDRIGRFVTLNEDKIKLASNEDNFILGIISGDPSIIGDSHDDQWYNMYETDIYGRPIFEEKKLEEIVGENGEVLQEERIEIVRKLNPSYNYKLKYIPRSERPEWDAVGMMGKLILIDDGSCVVNEYCKPSIDGVGTYSKEQTKYRVLKRLDENHVQILIL